MVLLIDEIDKADIEFPNDLLRELDRMEFHVYETRETIRAKHRPIVMITSNNEKELPDAFLRRCFFHYIRFPDRETMQAIVDVHFPGLKKQLLKEALDSFYQIRELPGLKKKPSTSELLDWLKLLVAEDIPAGGAALARRQDGDPAAARRAAQERAGHPPVRAAGLHGAAQPLTRRRGTSGTTGARMARWIEPVTLQGRHVLIEPMSVAHRDEIAAAAADGELWKLWYTSVPSRKRWRAGSATALGQRDDAGAMPFVIRRAQDRRWSAQPATSTSPPRTAGSRSGTPSIR